MDLQHVNVKLLAAGPAKDDLATLVPVFHGWIQEGGFDELLLDIADYSHVPAGPGVVLIGLQGDYSVDNRGGRLGVRYNRKAPLAGTNQERLRQAARAALLACRRLEADPSLAGSLRFGGREIDLFINDRLLAPNDAATREAAQADLDAFFQMLFRGAGYASEYRADARRLFGVTVKSSREFSVADLLANLGS